MRGVRTKASPDLSKGEEEEMQLQLVICLIMNFEILLF
jgi:hypothetical protein